ncbi:MAG: signal peptidase II [Verrucomicrobiales bacterium]|jgi:signal peptidase II|nr:signal peptidase II [Verrucomicrobiales bacterium]
MQSKPRWYFWTLLVTLLVADQISKWLVVKHLAPGQTQVIVSGWFNLTHVTNDGIAWGLLRGHNLLLGITIGVLLLVAAGWFARRVDWRLAETNILGAALLAGAFGNLVDRCRLGHVVDFADVFIPVLNYRWPAFNVADSCITLCVVWLFWRMLRGNKHI